MEQVYIYKKVKRKNELFDNIIDAESELDIQSLEDCGGNDILQINKVKIKNNVYYVVDKYELTSKYLITFDTFKEAQKFMKLIELNKDYICMSKKI